ncbi:MAG: hypothetical protein FWE90_13805 [Defluviitaleaceae bacterium]|nr:hypothetical protein [Defluviitaleaceae bacterium]
MIFDRTFKKRENKIRRNYEIEDNLYVKLEELSAVYDASVTDLINESLLNLIQTENIRLYEKKRNELSVTHTLLIRESNIAGLEQLKKKYGVSIFKLVNIAIRNALNEV